MTDLFHLQDVHVRYAARRAHALDVPDFGVKQGEVLALIGPSGAGKSTMLRLLGFADPPTAGRVEYRGVRYDQTKQPGMAVRRSIASVFQRPLPLSRSVYDNVAYGLRIRGQTATHERVFDALREVGLEHLHKAQARTLSGGELQRVALARALVLHTDVLLLDEPTANLDPANTLVIERAIKHANTTRQVTVVLVTHNIFQARRLAHRTALMLDGRVVEAGPTAGMFESPGDPRTAAFLRGEMVW